MVGDRLRFTDARESQRTLDVVAVGPDGCWAESTRTCYFTNDVRLSIKRDGDEPDDEASVGGIPPAESPIQLATGDLLILTREQTPGRLAACDSAGHVLNPATIGCTLPKVFEDVHAGEPVWIDDGRIGGVIERTEPDRIHVRITHTRARGAKLVGDKGINLPDSALRFPALTDKNRADAGFVAEHADMVALSFVNTVDDVRALRELLTPFGDRQPAIVLKIETKRGFENLPAMLLEAMKVPRCGVMIARGDLAVECGFERLAEVQEEILWICEAAHVPVIWATQVSRDWPRMASLRARRSLTRRCLTVPRTVTLLHVEGVAHGSERGRARASQRLLARRELSVRRSDLSARQSAAAEPLTPAHIKPRLLGHWGTTPGQNFIYAHLNRVIKQHDLNMIYIAGPGHGGPALVANTYLEGTYSEVYPHIGQDEAGLKRLFRQFSFPGGIPSHVAPETPGSIHEGGELGYSLSHAFGAVFDNPGPHRRLRHRRRRGRDGPARHRVALEQVPQSDHRRRGAAHPASERLQNREPDGAGTNLPRRAGGAAARLRMAAVLVEGDEPERCTR